MSKSLFKKISIIIVSFILLVSSIYFSLIVEAEDPIEQPTSLTANGSNPSEIQASSSFEISLDNSTSTYPVVWYKLDSAPTYNENGASTTIPFSVNASQTGGQLLYVWLEDSAGNIDYTKYASVNLRYTTDPLPPTSLTANGNTPSETQFTSNFEIDFSDSTSTYLTIWYKLGSEPTSDNDGESTTTKPFNVNATQVNGQTLYVWLEGDHADIDYNNNSSVVLNYIIATTTGLTANGNNPSESQASSSFSIDWTNSTSTYSTVWYKLGLAPTGNEDGSSTTTKPFTINATQTNGQDLHVWLEDANGNKDYTKYDKVNLIYTSDPSPPTSLSASESNFSDAQSSSTFSIDWSDSTTTYPTIWYKLSSEPTSDNDGESTTTKPFNIDAYLYNGQTLYAWLEDSAGNINFNNYASIALNYNATPTAPVNLTADGSNPSPVKSDQDFLIDWTNPDTLYSIESYWYKLGSAPTSNTDGATTTKPFVVSVTAYNGQTLYVWIEDDHDNVDYNNYSSVVLNSDGNVSSSNSSNSSSSSGGGASSVLEEICNTGDKQTNVTTDDGANIINKIINQMSTICVVKGRASESTISASVNLINAQRVILNVSDISKINEVSINLSKDALNSLLSNGSLNQEKNAKISITHFDALGRHKDFKARSSNALVDSDVFSVNFYANGSQVSKLNKSVVLSFDVGSVVENKNKLKIHYFDELSGLWKLSGDGGKLTGNKLELDINKIADFGLLEVGGDTPVIELATAQSDQVSSNKTEREQELVQILTEAAKVFDSGTNLDKFIEYNGATKDVQAQKHGMDTYAMPIVGENSGLSINQIYAINNYIVYGTPGTHILGAGERAGVVNSYEKAFDRFPITSNEWRDCVAIAVGRWPEEVSSKIENSKQEFKKIYLRDADMNNPNDNAAVTIITYGLRPKDRNLDSEAAAIRSFIDIYGYNPTSALDWDIVRAIAYSGAAR